MMNLQIIDQLYCLPFYFLDPTHWQSSETIMEPSTISEQYSSLKATYQQQKLVIKYNHKNFKWTRSELSSKPSENITYKIRILEYDLKIKKIKLQKYQFDFNKYMQKLNENIY